MAHTRTWNAAYEASPANTQDANLGATRIRELKTDVKERLALDHVMDETDDDGYHKQVTLEAQASSPANLSGKGRLFTKTVSGEAELFWIDSAGNEFRLTDAGKLLLLGTNNTWNKGQATTEVAITYAASITPDASLSNAFRCTLTGNVTLNAPSNGINGQVITILFIQDGTGGRTLTLSGIYGNTTDDLTLSTGASKIDLLTLIRSGSTARWRVISLKKDINNAL